MADPTSLTSIISEPLVQAGGLGAVILYCLVTDFITRRENRRIEAERLTRENAREARAQEREDACNKNMMKMKEEHTREMGALTRESHSILRTFIKIAQRQYGIKMQTPIQELETDTLVRKAESNEH